MIRLALWAAQPRSPRTPCRHTETAIALIEAESSWGGHRPQPWSTRDTTTSRSRVFQRRPWPRSCPNFNVSPAWHSIILSDISYLLAQWLPPSASLPASSSLCHAFQPGHPPPASQPAKPTPAPLTGLPQMPGASSTTVLEEDCCNLLLLELSVIQDNRPMTLPGAQESPPGGAHISSISTAQSPSCGTTGVMTPAFLTPIIRAALLDILPMQLMPPPRST